MKLVNLGLEDQNNVKKETEVVIYAKITNPEGLSQASKIENHEQAQIKTKKGSIRVRKVTITGNEPYYEMTSKIKTRGSSIQESIEKTERINKKTYDLFIETCDSFMSKVRYIFPVETITGKKNDLTFQIPAKGLNFEVDVFRNPKGQTSEWCKIDIEVDKLSDILKENDLSVQDIKFMAKIGKLPFKPNHVVIDGGSDEDPTKRELITALYQNEFLIPR